MDQPQNLGEWGHVQLDLLVVLWRGLSLRKHFGQQDGHCLREEAGAGIVVRMPGPAFGPVAGLLDQLALAGGNQLLAWLNTAGRQLQQELSGGVAILADQEDAGVLRVRFGIDGEDDYGAVVADDVAGGRYAAGLLYFVVRYPEDVALIDGFGGDRASAPGELERL